MVPNIKYYVVTIASIFLALAVGIFMGFMLDAQGLVTTQREDIVSQLETRFDELSEQTKSTNEQMSLVSNKNEELKNFLESSFPLLVKDSLVNRNIAIVQINEDYSYADIRDSLSLAGGSVTSITTIKDNLKEDEEAIKSLYLQIKGIETDAEIYDIVSDELVATLATGFNSPFIEELVAQGYLNVNGEYGALNDSVLIAGGSKENREHSEVIIRTLIEDIKESNRTAVGIEKSEAAVSHAEIYRNNRISSVDNVDEIMGKTSLVIVLRGVSGNFGTRDTAVALYPELSNLTER